MKMTLLPALPALSALSVYFLLALNAAALVTTSSASSGASPDDSPAFKAFLQKFEEGTQRFINGDPSLWKQHISRRDDASIMGGFGGYESGKEVGPRYDWAAAQFRPSGAVLEVEHLSSTVSGDLAYTVTIERSKAIVAGQAAPAPMALRVTHVFRKEDGEWKLLHRHADHLVQKAAPAAVLAK